jgi:ATP-dependent Zn protease
MPLHNLLERFDRGIYLGVPDKHGRNQILMMLTQNRKLEAGGKFNQLKIARATPWGVMIDTKVCHPT